MWKILMEPWFVYKDFTQWNSVLERVTELPM